MYKGREAAKKSAFYPPKLQRRWSGLFDLEIGRLEEWEIWGLKIGGLGTWDLFGIWDLGFVF
jgi:hypothetical protein